MDRAPAAQAPVRVWRDWALVGILVPWSILDALLREELAWRPVTATVGVVVAAAILWRRTHPLATVLVAFGTLTAVDVATILTAGEPAMPWSVSGVLLLPYALFRWGSGREAAVGLVIVLGWLLVTFTAEPLDTVAELAAGYAYFLLSAALGASIRYHATTRLRDIDRARLHEREQLARELHDTVAHHVSAVAVQAQAGRALAVSNPDRALATLEVIEEAASRTLDEMRTMVGVLRQGEAAALFPPPGLGDLERLARRAGDLPRVDVALSGDLTDLSPAVCSAVYRLAQESVTNGVRHARPATRVDVVGEASNGRDAVALARELRPDVCLLDIRMPGLDGIEATRQLAGPEVAEPLAVVVITTFDLDEYVHGALRAGARGWTNREIADALHISLSTVKTHLASLMRKLNARNRVEIAMWAYETKRIRS